MIKHITIIILFSISYTSSFFSEFIKFNDIFLNSSVQCINFDYKLKNSISEFPNQGTVKLAITEDKYTLHLDHYILLSQNSVLTPNNTLWLLYSDSAPSKVKSSVTKYL